MKKSKNFHHAGRIVSLLLALCMALALALPSAFAQTPDADGENVTIMEVDIGNVWMNLDSAHPVPFTAEVNPNSECVNQMEITQERWESADAAIKSTDEESERYPQAGELYWYAVTLTAKEGYVFSDAFNSDDYESNGVTAICDGTSYSNSPYNYRISVDPDGETLTMCKLFGVVAAEGGPQDEYVISDITIDGSTLSYNIGEAPKATATKADLDAPYTFFEYWEEMKTNSDGTIEPVAFWYSDPDKMSQVPEDKKITAFEEGKQYLYSVILTANEGYTFVSKDTLSVWMNGDIINDTRSVQVYDGGKTVEISGKTMTPAKPVEQKEIEVVEIIGATTTFQDGDKPVFTGEVPDGAAYYIDYERWTTDDGAITSSDFWNERYGDYEGSWGKLITSFEAGKTYSYGLYLKTTPEGAQEGWVFGPNTKLKVNGQDVAFQSTGGSSEMDVTWWIETELTMTPDNNIVIVFTDVPEDAYYAAPVAWAVDQGITNGMTETTFEPERICTRGQIVTFLWRSAGCPEPTSDYNPFADVSSTDYFYKAVLWAVEKGITNGMTATTFVPDGECTRGQAVTFLWRAAGQPAPTSANNPFKDVSSTDYYYQAVLWAAENGITNGMTETTFVPDNTCIRAQIVTFLYRSKAMH